MNHPSIHLHKCVASLLLLQYFYGSKVDSYWSFCKAGSGLFIVAIYPTLTISRSHPEGKLVIPFNPHSLGQTSQQGGCILRTVLFRCSPWKRLTYLETVDVFRYRSYRTSQCFQWMKLRFELFQWGNTLWWQELWHRKKNKRMEDWKKYRHQRKMVS
jgi:hypothetical protein